MFYLNNYKTHLCGKRWNSCVTHLRLNSPKPDLGKIYINCNAKLIHNQRTEVRNLQKILSTHHFSPAVKSTRAPNSLIIFKVEVVSHLVKLFLLWEMHWVAVKNAKFKKLTIWDSDAHPISEKIQNVCKEGNMCTRMSPKYLLSIYLNLC